MNWQDLVVMLIAGLAAAYLVRRLWRRRGSCCDCTQTDCADCSLVSLRPLSAEKQPPSTLTGSKR